MAELPELVELHREWSGKGVRVVAVSLDLAMPDRVDTAEELGTFVREREFALPLAAFAGDWAALAERYGLPGGPPSTLVLGRNGEELGRIEGPGTKKQLEELVTAALAR